MQLLFFFLVSKLLNENSKEDLYSQDDVCRTCSIHYCQTAVLLLTRPKNMLITCLYNCRFMGQGGELQQRNQRMKSVILSEGLTKVGVFFLKEFFCNTLLIEFCELQLLLACFKHQIFSCITFSLSHSAFCLICFKLLYKMYYYLNDHLLLFIFFKSPVTVALHDSFFHRVCKNIF